MPHGGNTPVVALLQNQTQTTTKEKGGGAIPPNHEGFGFPCTHLMKSEACIKEDVPWYIRCPIVNRMFNTCLVQFNIVTFTEEGSPLVGVEKRFLVPFKCYDLDIRSDIGLEFRLPPLRSESCGYGYGISICILEINHTRLAKPIKLEIAPTKGVVTLGQWQSELVLLKVSKADIITHMWA